MMEFKETLHKLDKLALSRANLEVRESESGERSNS